MASRALASTLRRMNSDNIENSIENMFKENVANVNESFQNEDEPLSGKLPLSKKSKTSTSKLWKYYIRIGIVDGKEKAQCKGLPKFKDIGVMMLDHVGKLRSRQVDPKRVREAMSMAIIEHDLPYSFVEYRRIRELLKLLNPVVKHISRNTATSDVWKFHLYQKDMLKKCMAKSRGRICLSSDCWTSYTTEGYICLTALFIDDSWKLNSRILSFCKMEPPHSGVELARKIFSCLKEWGIDRKIFSLTLDNASANDSMQCILKEHLSLQNSLLCGGEFFYIRCCAHILNLIVQEDLKVASWALIKIRESIKYVKASEARMISFNECVAQVGGIDIVVLDPRMKLDALKFCYSKLHPINWEQKLENVKTKLHTMFAQYETRDVGASSSSVVVPPLSLQTRGDGAPSKDANWEWINYVCETESSTGKSELDKYLEEPKLKPKYHENLDILGHWRGHQNEFPSLSKMACDILSIPITTVASESALVLAHEF
ncbi:zinc finger BED domain-containing protein RICESLEEPER 2-like [Senna tora]|uniref:Zinc finger BED domain-containing protein RICESLEEPER 2-like n=1 Tax=Senna tora TaxID=362788 RepID=A0A834W2A8_9FABA|nr:zinc finger BED domain-containing protein RICESLEEPER 2-like [Senna tora]